MIRPFFFLVVISFIISACCGNIQCDCIAPGISITYERINMDCPNSFDSDFLLKRFSEIDNQLISTGLVSEYGAINLCYLEINYEEDIYWVISSALFEISDTLRINNPVFAEVNDRNCCNCSPHIESADIEINDMSFTAANIVRTY